MNSDVGQMNFFEVEFCGLYKFNQSKKSHGCELNETFELISEWVKQRPFSKTIPWDPSSSKTNKPKCYCKDIFKDDSSGDFFVVLWKSDTSSTGEMWGAAEDDTLGADKVFRQSNKIKGKKVIWGRPCYYWIIPEYNVVISIKFNHSLCDAELFERYVNSAITNRVQHKMRHVDHTEHGYARISYLDDETTRYSYRFKKHLISMDTSSAELQILAANVTHIVRRETIAVHAAEEKSEWVKIFNKSVPFVAAKPKSSKRKIEIKAEAKPTVAEIREIIKQNSTDDQESNGWDNVGFSTDKGITWVDKYRLKGAVTILGKKDQVLSASELAENLLKKRGEIIEDFTANLEDDSSKNLSGSSSK